MSTDPYTHRSGTRVTPSPAPATPADAAPVDPADLTVAQLRERLEALGLDTKGKKADLLERYLEATGEEAEE